ncbi:hypothetical protein EDD39_2738 [Kitasatospora cineracea]|uniref:Uncharacterized protein n=2 Tax=Kitasatospora cineracea TaxID=88074 RepID=A0A8G1UIL5_9ACTN|nr:hypothetical protein EDD39_2738 [Kitasatospora cineracea]
MALPVPPGATGWKQPPVRLTTRTGVLNLDQFIAALYTSEWTETATRQAKNRGFVVAACHGWKNPDRSQVEVMLVEYESAEGAQSMYRGLRKLWTEDTSTTFFDDPDDQAAGLVHAQLNEDGMAYASLITTRRNVVIYITRFTPAVPDQETAQELFRQQLHAFAD